MPVYTEFRRIQLALAGALVASPVMTALLVAAVLPAGFTDAPPPLLAAAAVAPLAGAALAEVVFRRTRPLPAGTGRADADTAQRWQAAMVLRTVLVEAPFLATLALAFSLAEGGSWLVVASAVLTAALLAWQLVPSRSRVREFQRLLDAEGGDSRALEVLGLDAWTGTEDEKPTPAPGRP